ncbi:MAG TPA: glycosyltransferase family A protein [Bacteroidales bacterium]|nr:glycosyltransferase family A protein [Bacteroidales bacterium]
MSFADNYFCRFNSLPKIFIDNPYKETGIIVVIPCYDDEYVFRTLESLDNAKPPKCKTEIIIIINSGENSSQQSIANNHLIYNKLKQQKEESFYKNFDIYVHNIENIPKKIAGVGNARKTGMDEAVRRFNSINNADGIIVSLDADCLVDKNYFVEIEDYYKNKPKSGACTIQFQHDFNPDNYSYEIMSACRLYEIYLRYFRLALKYSGYPSPIHTIGSCFSVKAQSYIKVGGMSQRQGGEDFYFLHKLTKMTKVGTINKAIVFPSPRISDRVPFGTGPAVNKIVSDKSYKVYNFELFNILKKFFSCYDELYSNSQIADLNIPDEVTKYIGIDNLISIVNECKKNTNSIQSFRKRLQSKLDAFFIIKFLNSFDEQSDYPPVDVITAASQLLTEFRITTDQTAISVYDAIFEKDNELEK